ncbi:MAG: DUF3168 domain-containing protein [Sphingomonas sp.]|nr:DUF3168 domain-containing protein [Sphingomonas sp.]
MNAEQVWQAALLAALRGMAGLNGVYDGPPSRANAPWAELGDMLSTDWSTKDAAGRELRSTILLRDRAETPERLHALAATADDVVQAIARDLGDWQIASLILIRLRIIRDRPGGWTGLIEHRVRMLHI